MEPQDRNKRKTVGPSSKKAEDHNETAEEEMYSAEDTQTGTRLTDWDEQERIMLERELEKTRKEEETHIKLLMIEIWFFVIFFIISNICKFKCPYKDTS